MRKVITVIADLKSSVTLLSGTFGVNNFFEWELVKLESGIFSGVEQFTQQDDCCLQGIKGIIFKVVTAKVFVISAIIGNYFKELISLLV